MTTARLDWARRGLQLASLPLLAEATRILAGAVEFACLAFVTTKASLVVGRQVPPGLIRLRLVSAHLIQREHVGRLRYTLTQLVDLLLMYLGVPIVGIFGRFALSTLLNTVHLSHEAASAAGHVDCLLVLVGATLLSLLNRALLTRQHVVSIARAIVGDAIQVRLTVRADGLLPRERQVTMLLATLILLHAGRVTLWSLHTSLAQLAEVTSLRVRAGGHILLHTARVEGVDGAGTAVRLLRIVEHAIIFERFSHRARDRVRLLLWLHVAL